MSMSPTERQVKEIRRNTRRKFSSEEKIVRASTNPRTLGEDRLLNRRLRPRQPATQHLL